MQYDEFLNRISVRTNLPEDVAESALKAFAESFSKRVTPEETKDLRSQLPRELQPYFEPTDHLEKWSADEFLEHICERTGVTKVEASTYSKAIWSTIRESTAGAADHVEAQLPDEYHHKILA